VPNVQWKTPDDGLRNCPKHVEFLGQNKFGKVSASVCFIKKNLALTGTDRRFETIYRRILEITNCQFSMDKFP